MGAATTLLQVVRTADGFLIRIQGRGTLKASPALEQFVRTSLGSDHRIVVDLSRCEYLDSTFLGCLLKLRLHLQGSGQFVLMTAAGGRANLFGCSRIDDLFDFTDELPDTIGSDIDLEIEALEADELARHIMHCHRVLGDSGTRDAADFRSVADRIQVELDN